MNLIVVVQGGAFVLTLNPTIQVGAFVLGLILGSFLNALLFRFGTGRSVMHGRSACMRCGHALSTLDLVPVFSYLSLGGRCRYCGTKISPQYPLVEVLGGLLSLGVYVAHPAPISYAYWLLVWMTLLFVLVYDLRHKIIPLQASILLFVLAGIYLATAQLALIDVLAGPILAAPLFLLSLISGGRWMGWGDGILELSLGSFVGLWSGLTALVLGFWSGAIVGIALILMKKGLTMHTEVPFAPFLICGAAAVFFFHVDFFATLPLLFY